MKIRQAAYRPLAVVVGLTALLLFQGCYIKWGDETVVGQKDTALPGASVERGCVVKISTENIRFLPTSWSCFINRVITALHSPAMRARLRLLRSENAMSGSWELETRVSMT